MFRKEFALLPDIRNEPCNHPMFRYRGAIPCTGRLECILCGHTSEEIYSERQKDKRGGGS